MNLWKTYLRWRHTKGFGVHSPYAFELVNSVVRPGDYGYYGYAAIDRILKKLPPSASRPDLREDSRLLLRTVINIPAERIVSLGFNESLCRGVAKAAGVGYGKGFCKGDLVVIEKGNQLSVSPLDILAQEAAILAFDPVPSVRKDLEIPSQRGVLFSGPRIILRIPRREMAFVDYTVNF